MLSALSSVLYFTSAVKSREYQEENVAEKKEESVDQNDVWNKLKEFAG